MISMIEKYNRIVPHIKCYGIEGEPTNFQVNEYATCNGKPLHLSVSVGCMEVSGFIEWMLYYEKFINKELGKSDLFNSKTKDGVQQIDAWEYGEVIKPVAKFESLNCPEWMGKLDEYEDHFTFSFYLPSED